MLDLLTVFTSATETGCMTTLLNAADYREPSQR